MNLRSLPFTITSVLILLSPHSRGSTLGKRMEENNEEYLYKNTEAYPVLEYMVDKQELAQAGGLVRPSFVLDVSWPRVVQFYLPTSGVCQGFRQRFIDLAKEVRRRSSWAPVQFVAVSCTVHHPVCTDFDVTGVPHIVAFRAGTSEGIVVQRTKDNNLGVDQVAYILGVPLTADHGSHHHHYGAAVQELQGEAEESDGETVYRDAELSFAFSLTSSIYTQSAVAEKEGSATNNGLSPERAEAFREWIDLLHWSLPSYWDMHNLLNDIKNNMETCVSSRQGLMDVVGRHPPSSLQWSIECSRSDHRKERAGSDSDGYLCGTWKLLHVLTIGISEQHGRVLGDKDRISPEYALDTVRDFIFYFMLGCPSCQENFDRVYETCGFDLCTRLKQPSNKDDTSSTRYWKEFALWLWEYHNDVKLGLMKDEANQMGVKLTEENEMYALWPPRNSCPGCWKEGISNQGESGWDPDRLYEFLKEKYWPEGIQNARFVVLDRAKARTHANFGRGWTHRSSFVQLLVLLALSLAAAVAKKKLQTNLSGRHKKNDPDDYYDTDEDDEEWDFVGGFPQDWRTDRYRHRDSAKIYVLS